MADEELESLSVSALQEFRMAGSSEDLKIARIGELEREVAALRRYGDKNCTVMANTALAQHATILKVVIHGHISYGLTVPYYDHSVRIRHHVQNVQRVDVFTDAGDLWAGEATLGDGYVEILHAPLDLPSPAEEPAVSSTT